MEFLIVIAIIIALIIAYACANTFSFIAHLKGHDDNRYFWWTFFIPLLGALMVIALPDRKAVEKALPTAVSAGAKREKSPIDAPPTASAVSPAVDTPNTTPEASPVIVTPRSTGTEDQIECPACGKLQRANRTVCWECGAKFNKE